MAAWDALVSDLRAIFGTRLHCVVSYGGHAEGHATAKSPAHTLALVDSLVLADLDACARAASRWRGDGFAIPLLLPMREFARSLDAFPLEFGAILANHRVLYGVDPFSGLEVSRDDLRRACEIEVKGHLLHLREAYIESAGAPSAIARVVEASAPALRSLLANVGRLEGHAGRDSAALAAIMGAELGAGHERAFAGVLSTVDAPIAAADAARLFPAYLAAAEALAAYVDGWTTTRA